MARPTINLGTAAVLDIETTGFSPQLDEVIELAITSFHYDRVTGDVLESISSYSGLRQPSCPIPRCASAVHGITWHTVKGRQLDYRRIRAILRQAEFVIAHYATFDQGFVARLMPSFNRSIWLCSRDGIDWWAKGFESRSLEDLALAHNIQNPSPHRAAGDTATLLALLRCRGRGRRAYFYELLKRSGLIRARATRNPAATEAR